MDTVIRIFIITFPYTVVYVQYRAINSLYPLVTFGTIIRCRMQCRKLTMVWPYFRVRYYAHTWYVWQHKCCSGDTCCPTTPVKFLLIRNTSPLTLKYFEFYKEFQQRSRCIKDSRVAPKPTRIWKKAFKRYNRELRV